MKRFASFILSASTVAMSFVPTYIVDKYTLRDEAGAFVNKFGVVAETPSNRAGADKAQFKFAESFGR